MTISAVIVAAGQGKRMGAGFNKVYMNLKGRTVLETTVAVFESCEKIDKIIIVTDDKRRCSDCVKKFSKVSAIVLGGETRQESVKNGLDEADTDLVLIHDGARALISEREIFDVICDAEKYGAAAVGVKCKDTLKIADEEGFIRGTADREFTYSIQTPQAFKTESIRKMHMLAKGVFTDDCALAESFGERIKITEGSYENIKLTTPEDLEVAEKILERRTGRI